MVAAEEMGHKGVRAMSPVDSALAKALRVKLGKGRDLPEAPKPKRVPKPKTDEAGDAAAGDLVARKAASRSKKAKTEDEVAADVKPAATIVKPKPAGSVPDIVPQPQFVPEPEPEIVPEPTVVAASPESVAPKRA